MCRTRADQKTVLFRGSLPELRAGEKGGGGGEGRGDRERESARVREGASASTGACWLARTGSP